MMNWKSMLAIYFLFWAFSVFFVLPFYGRKPSDAAPDVPGQALSAPPSFPAGRIAGRVTIVATILFVLFQLNYSYGWVGAQAFDLLGGLANQ